MRLHFSVVWFWILLTSAGGSQINHLPSLEANSKNRTPAKRNSDISKTCVRNKDSLKLSWKSRNKDRAHRDRKPPRPIFDPILEAKAKAIGTNWILSQTGTDMSIIDIPDNQPVQERIRDRSYVKVAGAASEGKPLSVKAKGHIVTATLTLNEGHAIVKSKGQFGRRRETFMAPFWMISTIKNQGTSAQPGQRPVKISIKINGDGIAQTEARDHFPPD